MASVHTTPVLVKTTKRKRQDFHFIPFERQTANSFAVLPNTLSRSWTCEPLGISQSLKTLDNIKAAPVNLYGTSPVVGFRCRHTWVWTKQFWAQLLNPKYANWQEEFSTVQSFYKLLTPLPLPRALMMQLKTRKTNPRKKSAAILKSDVTIAMNLIGQC